jgi:hypothetical protein
VAQAGRALWLKTKVKMAAPVRQVMVADLSCMGSFLSLPFCGKGPESVLRKS